MVSLRTRCRVHTLSIKEVSFNSRVHIISALDINFNLFKGYTFNFAVHILAPGINFNSELLFVRDIHSSILSRVINCIRDLHFSSRLNFELRVNF